MTKQVMWRCDKPQSFPSVALDIGAGVSFRVKLCKSDFAEIDEGNGYRRGGVELAEWRMHGRSDAPSSMFLDAAETRITADGGIIGPIRYAVIFHRSDDGTETPIVSYGIDSLTLQDGEAFVFRLLESSQFRTGRVVNFSY